VSSIVLTHSFALTMTSTLFGGPSQPEPFDERGGIHRARLLAQEDEQCLNANQYVNDGVSYLPTRSRAQYNDKL
jgi:hypothetical protein